MADDTKKKATGYDKYVNWKIFFIPVALLCAVLLMPTPYGMKDVGTEYKVGPRAVLRGRHPSARINRLRAVGRTYGSDGS